MNNKAQIAHVVLFGFYQFSDHVPKRRGELILQ